MEDLTIAMLRTENVRPSSMIRERHFPRDLSAGRLLDHVDAGTGSVRGSESEII